MDRGRLGRERALAAVVVALVVAVGVGLGANAGAGRSSRARAHARTAPPTARAAAGLSALPIAARGPIAAALGRREPGYAIHGLAATNYPQQLRATFSPSGATILDGSARELIALAAYGRRQDMAPVATAAPRVDANRVSWGLGDVDEWWANGPLGLEQGFELRSRPAGGSGPLTLALRLAGPLRPSLGASGTALLRGAGDKLSYGGLSATDADGRSLPAHFALAGGRLLIELDDRGARYPVHVDPFVQQAELTDAGGAKANALGNSIAVAGNTVAVGAPEYGTDGAVFVFAEPAGGWASTGTPTATLTEGSVKGLGMSVAIDGGADTIVTGAVPPGQILCISCTQVGAVFLFTRPAGGQWASSATPVQLSPNDAGTNHELGDAVAIDAAGDTVAAGDPEHKVGSNASQGAAYVFDRPTNGVWKTTANQTAELTASSSGTGAGAASDELGIGVAITSDGSAIAAGAAGRTVGGNASQGAVYVFSEPHSGWSSSVHQASYLTASDGAADDRLGQAVAVSGDAVVAGAPQHGSPNIGAAYLFLEPAAGWQPAGTQNAELEPQVGFANGFFGESVAASPNGATIAVGAPGERTLSSPPGTVYVFNAPSGGWPPAASNLVAHQSYELTDSPAQTADLFGRSVAMSGGTLGAGAPGRTIGSNLDQGAAFAFGLPAPSVTIMRPTNGATYAQGSKVTASYACAVTGSTISSCSGTVSSGARISTSTPGSHSFTVTATTVDDVQATKTVTYSVLATPVLSKVSEAHKRWRKNTTFSFTVNEQATVKLAFAYAAAGRKVHGRCVAASRHNPHAHKCTRLAGTLTVNARTGGHKVKFAGRLGRTKLAPGSYVVSLTATNHARATSRPKSLRFTVN